MPQSVFLDHLTKGNIVLYPTDTIWGIGCDATNEKSIQRVYSIKNRPLNKPFICLVSSIEMLKQYTDHIHPRIDTLLEFHKRPLTVIYPNSKHLPSICSGSDGSIAIRVCMVSEIASVIEALGRPIISTSANLSMEPSPIIKRDLSPAILQAADYVYPTDIEEATGEPSVLVRINDDGELDFIR